jgi:hypothetical protein
MKKNNNTIILLTLYLTACAPLETSSFSNSFTSEIKVITSINAIDEFEPNINFRINQGAFADLRYLDEDVVYDNKHSYLLYYNDGTGFYSQFLLPSRDIITNTISQAFLYSRFVGWLPEIFRKSIKEINFKHDVLNSYSIVSKGQLTLNIKYVKDLDQDKREDKLFSSFVDIFLRPFYQDLPFDTKKTYVSIVNSSDFIISKKAEVSIEDDFFESYLFYLYYKNIEKKDGFEVFKYVQNMSSRFNFFESIDLDIKDYTIEEVEKVRQTIIKDSPLFRGTVWEMPLLFKDQEKSAFSKLEYIGVGSRFTYDHQAYPNGYDYRDNYLFVADYEPDYQIEFQFSSVFSLEEAEELAALYSFEFGKMPKLTRKYLNSVSLFKAPFAAGGGSGNIVIAVDPNNPIHNNPTFLEMVLHEASHASLDFPNPNHGPSQIGLLNEERWLDAAAKDNYFISPYAETFPIREDIAETVNVYLLYKYKAYMVDPDLIKMIERVIPNRIAYLDEFDFSFPK